MPEVHERMKEEHYHSMSAFFCGLLFEDLLKRTPHEFGPQIMSDPPEVQDAVVAEIRQESAKRRSGESRAGSKNDS